MDATTTARRRSANPRRAARLAPTVGRALLHNLAWCSPVLAAWLVAALLPGPTTAFWPSPAGEPSQVEVLISRHRCWTGGEHPDVIPGHAVVTRVGGRPRLVRAEVGFAIWLDGAPGTLHAFCP